MPSDLLTDNALRRAVHEAKALGKPLKKSDGRGLFALVKPNGAVLWRFKYALHGREKLLSLGVYPDVPLVRARERRNEMRTLVADGKDPSDQRKAAKAALADTVKVIALEWLGSRKDLDPSTIAAHTARLDRYVFPYIGNSPIRKLEPADLLRVLTRKELKDKPETVRRVHQLCGSIWRYGVATSRVPSDVTRDLRDALPTAVAKNHPGLTDPGKVGALLRAIDGYDGQPSTGYALQLAPLLFVRPGELRHAEWSEIDLDHAEWRIPGPKMKMRTEHVVPLARQAVATFREAVRHTGESKYVFPAIADDTRPMSENTINGALRRLGYASDVHVGHGFRTTASSLLNEMGWHPDLIELQLAHQERNKVRGTYNKAQRLEERAKMMQAWADYLDGLKARGNLVAIRKSVAA